MTVILMAVTILFFLGMDWLVHGRKESALARADAKVRSVRVRLPGGVFFSKSHTWVNLFSSGRALVGVDDFVSRLMEQPVVTLLKVPGERVCKGEPLFKLSSAKHSLTVRSPIEGAILASNQELEREPGLLRNSQFTDGWAYAVRPTRLADIKELFLGEETRGWIGLEFARLRDVFAGVGQEGALSPAMLQDGGPPIAGAMDMMDEEVWKRFDDVFLAGH